MRQECAPELGRLQRAGQHCLYGRASAHAGRMPWAPAHTLLLGHAPDHHRQVTDRYTHSFRQGGLSSFHMQPGIWA